MEKEESKTFYKKYKFFADLQQAVYEGIEPNDFRKIMKLPLFPENIPYWEIHHYPNGFKTSSSDQAQWFNQSETEHHVYFTFRSLVPDEIHQTMLKALDFFDNNTGFTYYTVDNPNIVDKFYGKGILNQHVRVFILDDDKDNNIDTLKKLSPEIFNWITARNGIPANPKDFPQMLFIGGDKGPLNIKTNNVNSIVCLDSFSTRISGNNNELPTISGNLFMGYSSSLFQMYASVIGKNLVIGMDSAVESDVIQDSVAIGNKVIAERHSILMRGCFVSGPRDVKSYTVIPAFQKIVLPEFGLYNMFSKINSEVNYSRFNHIAEMYKKSYEEEGYLPGFT